MSIPCCSVSSAQCSLAALALLLLTQLTLSYRELRFNPQLASLGGKRGITTPRQLLRRASRVFDGICSLKMYPITDDSSSSSTRLAMDIRSHCVRLHEQPFQLQNHPLQCVNSDAGQLDTVSLLRPMWDTPKDFHYFLRYSSFDFHTEYSQLLAELKQNPIIAAAGGVKHIDLPNGLTRYLPFELLRHSGSCCSEHYIIRDFYGKFLKCAFQSTRQNVVVGSPGIGKSAFLLYVLMYLMRPELQDPSLQLLNEVEYVLYVTAREHDEKVLVLVPGKQLAFTTDKYPHLSDLDSTKCLYVFEAGVNQDDLPDWATYIKSLVLVPPDPSRIVKFCRKADGGRLFMPNWALEETLAANEIAGYPVHPEVVLQRFNEVGGIPRALLTNDGGYAEYRNIQSQYLYSQQSTALFRQKQQWMCVDSPANRHAHHFIQYDVEMDDFYKPISKMTNGLVTQVVRDCMAGRMFHQSLLREFHSALEAGLSDQCQYPKMFDLLVVVACMKGEAFHHYGWGGSNASLAKLRGDTLNLKDFAYSMAFPPSRNFTNQLIYPDISTYPAADIVTAVEGTSHPLERCREVLVPIRCTAAVTADSLSHRQLFTMLRRPEFKFHLESGAGIHFVLVCVDNPRSPDSVPNKWNESLANLWNEDSIREEASSIVDACENWSGLQEEFGFPQTPDRNATKAEVEKFIAETYEHMLNRTTYSVLLYSAVSGSQRSVISRASKGRRSKKSDK